MTQKSIRQLAKWGMIALAVWLGVRYLLPAGLPFVFAMAVALACEPFVIRLQRRLHWKRLPASLLCVSVTLLLLTLVLAAAAYFAVRELSNAARQLPQLGQTVMAGLDVLQDHLITLADSTPEPLRPALIEAVLDTFQNSSRVVSQATGRLPGLIKNFAGWLSKSALAVGTWLIAVFLISIRMPMIKNRLSPVWRGRIRPVLEHLRQTVGCWLTAQLKLMVVTWAVLCLGLALLKIRQAVLWAFLIALVDAVPVLGTGTVMVPWAIVCFLQGARMTGVGLIIVFGVCWLVRNLLEPRLVGKSLGLDPLLSLAAFYLGFRIFGIAGMLLGPIAAAVLRETWKNSQFFHKETS